MWEHRPSEIVDLTRVRIGVTSDPMNTARGLHFTDEYEASDDVLAIPQRSTEERPRMTNEYDLNFSDRITASRTVRSLTRSSR